MAIEIHEKKTHWIFIKKYARDQILMNSQSDFDQGKKFDFIKAGGSNSYETQ